MDSLGPWNLRSLHYLVSASNCPACVISSGQLLGGPRACICIHLHSFTQFTHPVPKMPVIPGPSFKGIAMNGVNRSTHRESPSMLQVITASQRRLEQKRWFDLCIWSTYQFCHKTVHSLHSVDSLYLFGFSSPWDILILAWWHSAQAWSWPWTSNSCKLH